MDNRVFVAIAALCLTLIVVAQAAFFVYAEGQAWWPWNGFWMVLTGALVLAIVWVAGQRREQVTVRSRALHDHDRGLERR